MNENQNIKEPADEVSHPRGQATPPVILPFFTDLPVRVFVHDDEPGLKAAISQSRGEARKTVPPHVTGASLESPLSMSPER
jgi:hypothetical protein